MEKYNFEKYLVRVLGYISSFEIGKNENIGEKLKFFSSGSRIEIAQIIPYYIRVLIGAL